METLGAVAAVVVVIFLAVSAMKRRGAMTPEQRQLADLKREQAKLKREQRKHRYD